MPCDDVRLMRPKCPNGQPAEDEIASTLLCLRQNMNRVDGPWRLGPCFLDMSQCHLHFLFVSIVPATSLRREMIRWIEYAEGYFRLLPR
jgi:hypothetical protein